MAAHNIPSKPLKIAANLIHSHISNIMYEDLLNKKKSEKAKMSVKFMFVYKSFVPFIDNFLSAFLQETTLLQDIQRSGEKLKKNNSPMILVKRSQYYFIHISKDVKKQTVPTVIPKYYFHVHNKDLSQVQSLLTSLLMNFFVD